MIFPLSQIIPVKDIHGNKALVITATDRNTGMPIIIALIGFEFKEDLKEAASYLSGRILQIYSRYDQMGMEDPEMPTTPVPDFLFREFPEGLEL